MPVSKSGSLLPLRLTVSGAFGGSLRAVMLSQESDSLEHAHPLGPQAAHRSNHLLGVKASLENPAYGVRSDVGQGVAEEGPFRDGLRPELVPGRDPQPQGCHRSYLAVEKNHDFDA